MKFFRARSPSMPKSLRERREVFTCREVSLTSPVCRMASMADTREARLAGM